MRGDHRRQVADSGVSEANAAASLRCETTGGAEDHVPKAYEEVEVVGKTAGEQLVSGGCGRLARPDPGNDGESHCNHGSAVPKVRFVLPAILKLRVMFVSRVVRR